mgnify:CR=1 FL=1|jgi:hypothetical protein
MREREFHPFRDDDTAISIGAMTIENGLSSVVVHGELVIGKDLQDAAALRGFIVELERIEASIVRGLRDAPDDVATVEEVDNPFL